MSPPDVTRLLLTQFPIKSNPTPQVRLPRHSMADMISFILVLLLALSSYVSGESLCRAKDFKCWGSYVRLETNKARREAGVPTIYKAPESATLSARTLALELAQKGKVYTRDEQPSGCGWVARGEMSAAVVGEEIAHSCVQAWASVGESSTLFDASATGAAYAHALAPNGTVYCVQMFVDVDDGARCSAVEEESSLKLIDDGEIDFRGYALDAAQSNTTNESTFEANNIEAEKEKGNSVLDKAKLYDGTAISSVEELGADGRTHRCYKICVAE